MSTPALARRRPLLVAVAALVLLLTVAVPAAMALTKIQAEGYAFKRLQQRVKSFDDKHADYECVTAGRRVYLCTIVYYGSPDGGCFEILRVSRPRRGGKVARKLVHTSCD
jgi:hypothetical protein